jgi:hypothetical protein
MLPNIAYNIAFTTKTTNKFDEETDEKDSSEEDAETQWKAESVPLNITNNPVLEIKIPNRFEEKDQEEEADKTERKAESVLIAITYVHFLKIKTAQKFDKVTAERDQTEEFYVEQQNAVHTTLIPHKYIKNNHTALKTISVQVVTEKAEFEVQKYVESKNAGSAVLAAIKTA